MKKSPKTAKFTSSCATTAPQFAATLLSEVEAWLARHRVSPSRLGRDVSADPRLVFDMRRGRTLSPPHAARLLQHLHRAPTSLPPHAIFAEDNPRK